MTASETPLHTPDQALCLLLTDTLQLDLDLVRIHSDRVAAYICK